jgi:hypothetical protein
MTALPTIHLNGTGADSLQREYCAVRKSIAAAADALAAATCNRRDFYARGDENIVSVRLWPREAA